MATRADIVRIALSQNGYDDGLGYDEMCKYTESFGLTFPVAYCDIFVAWCFEQAGIPLPPMSGYGLALRSGAQYCPDSWNFASARGATIPSWEAQPGDQVIFNWQGDSAPLGGESHTEIVETWSDGYLYTVGGNSGPSNIDGFSGAGGVHRHAWSCPIGVGNGLVQGVIDTGKLVQFSTTEDLILTPEDKAYLDAKFATFATKTDVSQLVKVFEDGASHSFGMEGVKDVYALLQKLADHQGVK